MKKTGRKEIICYGIGDFACNGFCTIISSYLMFFYSDVAKMPLASVGLIIFVSRFMDAAGCLGMGWMIDRTNTRWGKARPYLIWVGPPLCVMLVALFSMPETGESVRFWYALVVSTIYSLLYCGLSVSYSTMMTCMTRDETERMKFNITKTICSNLGAFFVTGVTLFGVEFLGREDRKKGFGLIMGCFAILYLLLLLVCFKNTCERVQPQEKKIPLGQAFRIALGNRYWLVLCILDFFMLFGMTLRNQGTLYYAAYCLNREELGTVLLSMSTFLAALMVVFASRMSDKIGKVRCIAVGYVLQVVGMTGMYLAQRNISLVLFFHVIASVGNGLASGLVFVMLAEVVDFSEYQTGMRPQGLLTSTVSFMMKLGCACAGVTAAKILELGGYSAGNHQKKSVLTTITINYIWLPLLLSVVCLVVIHFYTLDKEYIRAGTGR